jgi:2,5-diamino-6-(ribosylamino)-4(3H)-pyrimidinone 5'-phosphate reductase
MTVNRPHVVAHLAVSLEGATTGFDVDVERFYELAQTWHEDVTLAGADTILAQEGQLATAPRPGPARDAPLLAVVDSRRRVTQWQALRDCGYWSGVVALRSRAVAPVADDEVQEIVAGSQRVNLATALAALDEQHGARVVRVDSGGELTGALLRQRLLDELSLLVHPCTVGAASTHRWYGSQPPPSRTLTRLAAELLPGGLVWLRYATPGPTVSE